MSPSEIPGGGWALSQDYIVLDIERTYRQPPGWYASLAKWQRARLMALWQADNQMRSPPAAPELAAPTEAPETPRGRFSKVLRHPGNMQEPR